MICLKIISCFQNIHVATGLNMHRSNLYQIKRTLLIWYLMVLSTGKRAALQRLQIGCAFAKTMHYQKGAQQDAPPNQTNKAFV